MKAPKSIVENAKKMDMEKFDAMVSKIEKETNIEKIKSMVSEYNAMWISEGGEKGNLLVEAYYCKK